MRQYLDIVKRVLEKGRWKSPVRKNQQTGEWEPVDGGVRTLACPNVCFSHEMSDGFPLLTTKKMAFKAVRVELEGFINGITDKKWYQNRKCRIWNEWSNPALVTNTMLERGLNPNDWDERKKVQAELNDLGPIYGYQWRRFGEHYGCEGRAEKDEDLFGVHCGTDQLKNIVDTLIENPMDRRMVCSAWNPNQIHLMALPPCHYSWNVTVIGDELNLFWAQRSCDLMLGVPFNIASYALLLELLAKTAGFKPGNLSGMLVDCHIYENQINVAREQVKRIPRELPSLIFENNNGNLKEKFNILDWTHEDVSVNNYNPYGKIDFWGVVV